MIKKQVILKSFDGDGFIITLTIEKGDFNPKNLKQLYVIRDDFHNKDFKNIFVECYRLGVDEIKVAILKYMIKVYPQYRYKLRERIKVMENLKINVVLDDNAKMPTKAHDQDAGFDIYAPEDVILHGKCNVIINTGVHFEIPKGYVGMIKSKSGLNHKGIAVEGVIDSGYTGPVVLNVVNNSPNYIIIRKGEKVTQIVFLPIPDVELLEVDALKETERGNGGFGSTGK